MPPGMGGLPQPPMPPGFGAGGMPPGMGQGNFTNPQMPPGMSINGFSGFGGGNNPSWGEQFGPGGSISGQMAQYDPSTMGQQPQGSGLGMGMNNNGRPPWMA